MSVKINENLLLTLIGDQLKAPPSSLDLSRIGGGSINATYKIKLNGATYFAKANTLTDMPALLEKEQNGLAFLAKQRILRVPEIISHGSLANLQFLMMEWIQTGTKMPSFWTRFGEQLARLHRTKTTGFGFFEDNYMGALPQSNDFSTNWTEFFIEHRLQVQIRIATGKGLLSSKHISSFEALYKKLNQIFNEEDPSLLHGDLWYGNFICGSNGEAVLIDPAVYFGHRSMDLGMTTLFGGFEKSFYDSYHYHFPLPANYQDQWSVCNLYPLLIHLNLFGSSYLGDINVILKKFAG